MLLSLVLCVVGLGGEPRKEELLTLADAAIARVRAAATEGLVRPATPAEAERWRREAETADRVARRTAENGGNGDPEFSAKLTSRLMAGAFVAYRLAPEERIELLRREDPLASWNRGGTAFAVAMVITAEIARAEDRGDSASIQAFSELMARLLILEFKDCAGVGVIGRKAMLLIRETENVSGARL